ncbi:MAG: leucyl/phenylalanyl-tRNA--protein transferase [Providencia alcalifaciens]|jgi:leucyl/phenylalanyl-tRNA--protein transferase|nr:leucyl/phenylalanyl-tRNA--protein transferase [Providencia alcalifaciens]
MYQLDDDSYLFPPVSEAMREPNGLLAIGGNLSSRRLQAAYYDGIFPWFNPGEVPLWWSPDPRAVLKVGDLHISRSMIKTLKKSPYRITINHAFKEVIAACAVRKEGTWILPSVQAGYLALHQEGHAHSIEAWHGDQLVGGLYGVNMGYLFCGESMFSRMNDASKCAFITFYFHFLRYNGQLFDCQVLNHHTASLGATEISRRDFLHILYRWRDLRIDPACWLPQSIDLPQSFEKSPLFKR